jgi:hypothetical protein
MAMRMMMISMILFSNTAPTTCAYIYVAIEQPGEIVLVKYFL